MADLWQEINKLLMDNPKIVTIKDIKDDINWLYKKKDWKAPTIIIFNSFKKFRAYYEKGHSYNKLEDQTSYGLYNEIEFYAHWMDNEKTPDLDRYIKFLQKGIYYAVFGEKEALICANPKKILLNENNEFHSLKGPAILWHDDTGKYYMQGRKFAKRLFNQVCRRKLSMVKVLSIKNIEQRYVVLRLYGIDRLMKELNPTLISETEKGNKLYSVKLDDNLNANFLMYSCPSTARVYTKFVDHTKNYKCADHAMAESHNMTKEQYLLMEHEG